MVAPVDKVSSYFLLVKISTPTIVAFADPCLLGFVDSYVTWQGKPLSIQ